MKVTVSGVSCSSTFSIIQEVQSNDTIAVLITKIEQAIPCTKITGITYKQKRLDKTSTFESYNILNGALLNVETDAERSGVYRATCMGCSYHNMTYMSANVEWIYETQAQTSIEGAKASLHQCISKLNIDDQNVVKSFFNRATDGTKIRFFVCIRDMLESYVRIYRHVEHTNLVDFSYCQLLNELRCPVCYTRFSLYSQTAKIPVRMCTVSEKHYICEQCFRKIERCSLCQSKLCSQPVKSEYFMNLLRKSMEQIKAYCLPSALNHINITDNQQPFAFGAFCNVFRVGNYAIKCPRVPTSPASDVGDAIIHEIFISRPLSHIPNILITYGGIQLPKYGLSIVTEFIDGPTLATALNEDVILNLPFSQRLDIALGICKGLGELHLAGIIHRDLKPSNILLQKHISGHGYVPKIADFGVSFLIQTATATLVKQGHGTAGYEAPEVADGGAPSFQSDIYALAFTLYELLTVQHPFANLTQVQILKKFIVNGERPKDWTVQFAHSEPVKLPDFLKNVIENGWSANAATRTNIGEITRAIRKSIQPFYETCVTMMSTHFVDNIKNITFDFTSQYGVLELLAMQEVVKRLIIEDREAIDLLLNNYAWG